MRDSLDSVRQLYLDLIDAWNRRDAADFARLFASQGGMVGFDGSTATGPGEIEGHLSPIFADHPTARFVPKIRDIRSLGSDAAIVRAVAGMVPPDGQHIMPDRNAIQTLVASRGPEGVWTIEMFQNTPAAFHGRPEEAQRLTKELEDELEAAS